MKTREDILSLAETAKRWAKLEQEFQDRLSMGGFNTKAQDIDLFEAEEAMKEAAVRSLHAPTPPAAEASGQEPVAHQWRSRIKGGAWDAWENGRFGHTPPPFMEIEERALYAAPPTYADAEAKGTEAAGIEKAAKWHDERAVIIRSMVKPDQSGGSQIALIQAATRHEINAAAIRSLASPAPKGET